MRKSQVNIHRKGTPDYVIAHAMWKQKRGLRPSIAYRGERNPKKALALAKLDKAKEPTFLYPRSRQFPFDEICERIVRELERRNWNVPGIEVDFDVYGSGESRYRMVSHLKGLDFKLWFSRIQGSTGNGYNDKAAVTEIVIPQKELHVYEDESGPTFYTYVGDDWENDKDRFMNGSKFNSKRNGKLRTYLEYKGTCRCGSNAGASFEAIGLITSMISGDTRKIAQMGHSHSKRRSPLLVHTNDLGREYDLEEGDPAEFLTSAVMEEFTLWITENVLDVIKKHPVSSSMANMFPEDKYIPYPKSIGSLFTFGGRKDENRIKQGKKDRNQLRKEDRYGLSGNGYRLVSLDVGNDGTFPELAYDGFKWCGIGKIDPCTPFDSFNIPGGGYSSSNCEEFVIQINPKNANGIYIVDMGTREEYKKKIFEENPEQKFLTNGQYFESLRVSARTLIPITEYKGDYREPVVLINREIGFEEVEIVYLLKKAC